MHVHYAEARWEVTCKELTLLMQLEAKYTCGASLTPHNRNYIHSTCYNGEKVEGESTHLLRGRGGSKRYHTGNGELIAGSSVHGKSAVQIDNTHIR